MTTLPNRPNTAVIVVDVQNKVMANSHDRAAVIANIGAVVEKARGAGAPVIWVQHESEDLPKGTEDWRIVPELVPVTGEALVGKEYGDSFEATTLEKTLADLGVGKLVVTGAQTDACIRATIHGGLTRGYDVILVSDAHSTEDLSAYGAPPPDQVIRHTNLYWKYQTAPGRTAGTVSSEKVAFD